MFVWEHATVVGVEKNNNNLLTQQLQMIAWMIQIINSNDLFRTSKVIVTWFGFEVFFQLEIESIGKNEILIVEFAIWCLLIYIETDCVQLFFSLLHSFRYESWWNFCPRKHWLNGYSPTMHSRVKNKINNSTKRFIEKWNQSVGKRTWLQSLSYRSQQCDSNSTWKLC